MKTVAPVASRAPPPQAGTRSLLEKDWKHRIQQFQLGEWLQLLQQADRTNTTSNNTNNPRDDAAGPDETRRTERAQYLVHLRERLAARQALTAGPLLAPNKPFKNFGIQAADPNRNMPCVHQKF